jgi:hypothetical protein
MQNAKMKKFHAGFPFPHPLLSAALSLRGDPVKARAAISLRRLVEINQGSSTFFVGNQGSEAARPAGVSPR